MWKSSFPDTIYWRHFLFSIEYSWLPCQIYVVQLVSHVWLLMSPWTAALQASLSFTISQSLLKLMSIELVIPSNHLILCSPLLLPSVFPSIRIFSNEPHLFRWPKHWSFSISPSNEYSGLVSFRIWLVWSLCNLRDSQESSPALQFEASTLKHSAFFMVQLSKISLVAQLLKNLQAMQETQVWSLGQEDPLEKEMALHSSIMAWRIPWTEKPGELLFCPLGCKESGTIERLTFSHIRTWLLEKP